MLKSRSITLIDYLAMAYMKADKENELANKRQTRLNLRLSDLEYTQVLAKAEGFGLPLAKFVRVCLLGLPEPAKRLYDLPVVDPKLMRQIVSIGNNINQLTRYAHTVSNDPKQVLNTLELAFALQRLGDELQLLREQYSLKPVATESDVASASPVISDSADLSMLTKFDESV